MNPATIFHPDHATIGTLLAALRDCEPEKRVVFDFCDRAPNGIHCTPCLSGDLALGHASLPDVHRPTAKRLIDVLYGAIHQTWNTVGGHQFKASSATRLWVNDMFGDLAGTVVTGLKVRASAIILTTDLMEVDQ